MKGKNTFSNYVLIGLFLLALVSPYIQNIFKVIPDVTNTENRRLADKPVFDLALLDPFPAKYELYYNDHFAFRNHFVKLFAQENLDVFGKCPYPDQVIIGKNNELFLVFRELDTYLNKNLFTNSELNKLRSDFAYRKQYLKDRGVDYYVALCPTKYSVYPERLPWYVKPIYKGSRTDQFVALLKELDIKVIDIKSAIIKVKDSIPDQLYRKNDNHWNDLGAFVAYREIMKQISKSHPGIRTLQFSDFTITPNDAEGGNLAIILNRAKEMRDVTYTFTPKFTSTSSVIQKLPYPVPADFEAENFFHGFQLANEKLPKILIFHDSFGNSIQPFIKESFSRSIFIWDKWQYKLNEPIVEAEKPDIYVTLVLESLLQGLMENCEYK